MLTALDIHKSYKLQGQAPTEVLRGADFSCASGEFVALVGPSGAGKSTLLHILASLDVPDKGDVSITFNGKAVKYSSLGVGELAKIRNSVVGMIFQFHHLLPEFTALENVMMPLLIAGNSNQQAGSKAEALIERVGMSARKEHLPTELSGGEQQRIAIARALINEPQILFADEPTGNLDSDNAKTITDLLVELQQQTGVTCIVATHSAEIAQRAHRVVRMKDGRCES